MDRKPIGTRLLLTFLTLGLLALGTLQAATPEVQNVRSASTSRFVWDSLIDTVGYHVYRGQLDELTIASATCVQGSVQSEAHDVTDTPAPGTGWFFLVSGFDASGPGPLGQTSAGLDRQAAGACMPARRLFPQVPNGDAVDGVADGHTPRRGAGAWSRTGGAETVGVHLHTGELFVQTTDLSIPGRGLDWSFVRHYRSQIDYDGPIGHGWDHTWNRRLRPLGTDVVYHDGTGRGEVFFRVTSTTFSSPRGQYAVLRENPDDSFDLRHPDGTLLHFHAFDGSNLEGALETVTTRNGNRIALGYDPVSGMLATIADTLGRRIDVLHDTDGRITSIVDFAGRTLGFTYDAQGNLQSFRSPAVTGTPNGNDFPSGKVTGYGYEAAPLEHNLNSIVAPNEAGGGPARFVATYGTTSTDFSFDRVGTLTVGGTNASAVPAGGQMQLSYLALNPGADPADLALPRRRATLTDRNGNVTEYTHNASGNLIARTDFTNRELRAGEPDYTTTHAYNADGERVQTVLPEGNQLLFAYDSPGADRFREGNRIQLTRLPGPRGGDQASLVTTYTYEPLFNRVATVTDPRGNDASFVPPVGTWSPNRYTTRHTYDYQEDAAADNGVTAMALAWGIDLGSTDFDLGDVNGDGTVSLAGGNRIRVQRPTVELLPGSNQATIEGDTSQEVVTLLRYNDLGQPTTIVDAEHNVHELVYHPETDPDGDGTPSAAPPDGRTLDPTTGGYLQTLRLDTTADAARNNHTDPAPAAIRTDYEWDAVGNCTGTIDGRGVLTRTTYNALNQPVQIRLAAATRDESGPGGAAATGRGEAGLAAFGFIRRLAYDANDNLASTEIEDRDLDRDVGTYLERDRIYDILDRLVQLDREATSTTTLSTQFGYDANENLIRLTEPVGNFHLTRFDERDLKLESTRGAGGPRGGTPAVRAVTPDGNGAPVTLLDARGNPVDAVYDGFDRLVRTLDAVGNTTDLSYDPASNLVRVLRRGPVGGPAPTDRSGATNVDLEDTACDYDELDRRIEIRRELFVHAGATPGRPPILEEGALAPADGAINARFEWDALSRRTFATTDDGSTTGRGFDGINRRVRLEHPDGSSVAYTYDAASNLIETVETELPSLEGAAPEIFLTTFFYDAINRRTMVVDSVGQTQRFVWDSIADLRLASDANGPDGADITRRSPGNESVTVTTNGHGNVTRYSFDGLNRLLSRTGVITASGSGDGTMTSVPDLSNPANPDGLATTAFAWDDNGLPSQRIDDSGNVTVFGYDNLDRLVLETRDDGTQTASSRDGEGNVTLRLDPNGSAVSYSYDGLNRRTSVSVAPGSGVEGTTAQSFEYDGLNRLTYAFDNNVPADANDDAVLTFVWDSLGRPIEEAQTVAGAPAALVSYGWAAHDRLTRLVYPSGRAIQYSYDGMNRRVGVADPERPEGALYRYFGLHRVHTRNFSNGVTSTFMSDDAAVDIGFDGARRAINLRHLDGVGNVLAGFESTYDRGNERTTALRTHVNRQDSLGYDSLDRLVGFAREELDDGPTLVDEEIWDYDGVGSWTATVRNGTTYTNTPNNLNEYDDDQSGGTRVDDGLADDFLDDAGTGIADGMNLAHDANGNQVDNGSHEIKFDFLDRPVRAIHSAENAVVATYAYDAINRRVRENVTNSGLLDRNIRNYHATSATAIDWDNWHGESVAGLWIGGGVDSFFDIAARVVDNLGVDSFFDIADRSPTNPGGPVAYVWSGCNVDSFFDIYRGPATPGGPTAYIRGDCNVDSFFDIYRGQAPPGGPTAYIRGDCNVDSFFDIYRGQATSGGPTAYIRGDCNVDSFFDIYRGQATSGGPTAYIRGDCNVDSFFDIYRGQATSGGPTAYIRGDCNVDSFFDIADRSPATPGGPTASVRGDCDVDSFFDIADRSRCITDGWDMLARVIEERDGTNTAVRQVVFGVGDREQLWQIDGDGKSQYFLADAQGSTAALIDSTTEPAVLERYEYDPFGRVQIQNAAGAPLFDIGGTFRARSLFGNRTLFLGRRYDPELGLRTGNLNTDQAGYSLFGSRLYNPNQGRFVTRDRNAVHGYSFAGNNPASGGSFIAVPGFPWYPALSQR